MGEIDYNSLTSYGDEERLGGGQGNVNVYDGSGYYVTVRLSDIRGARIEEVENHDTGEDERGLFIPFSRSGVTVTARKDVLATYAMSMAQVPSAKYTHLLRQIVDKDVEEYWRRLGYSHAFDGFASPNGYRKKKKFKY